MGINFSQIPYALANGNRHSWPSIEVKIDSQLVIGAASIEYERTRTRSMLYGTNSDPIGKTRGQNAYKATIELYLAEFYAVLEKYGDGYGDVFFPVVVSYAENGFDTITDTIIGCTLDSSNGGGAKGTEGLTRKFELNPIKILFGGKEDNAIALVAPSA